VSEAVNLVVSDELAGLNVDAVVRRWGMRLRSGDNALTCDESVVEWLTGHAVSVVLDCLHSMAVGRITIDLCSANGARALPDAMLERGLQVGDVIRAGSMLLDVLADALAADVPTDRALLGLRAAERSLAARTSAVATSYDRIRADQDESARRDERHRLAREVHDFVGGGVSVVQRHLELHLDYLERADVATDRHAMAMHRVLGELVDGTRRLLRQLRAQPEVNRLGNALQEFATTSAPEQVDVRLDVGGDRLLTGTERTELYLICQEGLRNSFAHAQASTVTVRVRVDPDQILAEVDDDGVGFEPGPAGDRQGLLGMRERAHLLGGDFELSSAPGGGTRIAVCLPRSGDSE
jgi:signal transduction histidine kinase